MKVHPCNLMTLLRSQNKTQVLFEEQHGHITVPAPARTPAFEQCRGAVDAENDPIPARCSLDIHHEGDCA